MFNGCAVLWHPERMLRSRWSTVFRIEPVGAGQEGPMTKADIVDEIAERTGLTKKDVADTVDQFLDAVSRALASGKHIEIRGFGTFKVKDRKSRLARNPRTGESVPVPPRRVPVFKVSKELKDIVAQV